MRRIAFVSGAGGGGIGSELVRRLNRDGMAVAANGLERHRPQLEKLALNAPPQRPVVPVIGDVSNEAEVRRMVNEVRDALGPVAVLVNNAAPSRPPYPVQELSKEVWDADLAEGLTSCFLTARYMAEDMLAAGWGRMVHIGSNAGVRGALGRSAGYAAAKAGIVGLSAQLAVELGPNGVTSNVVAPSQVDTPRIRRGGRRDDASLERTGQRLPLRRVGRPDDIASLVSFLASQESGYITGQVINVDGGSTLSQNSLA